MTTTVTAVERASESGKKLEFKGVFPANPTPVQADGRINEGALRAIFEENLAHGVDGFWVAGSTGEGPVMSDQQRETTARIAGETISGRGLSIMHVGAISTESAVKGAKAARESGCDAVCCVPPFFFRASDDTVIEHYKRVVDAADGLPFFVYNLPQLTQVETNPPLMEKIVENVPNVMGLKHSAPNFSDIRIFANMGLKCFSGNGTLPLPALTMGAVGTVDAPLSIAPWHYSELFDAWERGDIETAQRLQDGVVEIVDIVRMFGAPAAVTKLILSERLGVDCGRPIPPVADLTDEQRVVVLAAARDAGLLQAP
ncbi:MAG: dihydrodipicolinate synthase family protein [Chloroflexi bacterium]|nr:dihydrodipicolinate synthase family protein [Chloroflexota bacterium]MCI0802885.1 dihydrodipicolinate synthase family protein [Chloroflexota bacterium]MCI0835500.1 dihydrodipicolinate synthase family protein [Chloroflexota bacterium]MCI0870563.1 dihydrodipicolinate synthase family protein [Chloroflexota bacterium]